MSLYIEQSWPTTNTAGYLASPVHTSLARWVAGVFLGLSEMQQIVAESGRGAQCLQYLPQKIRPDMGADDRVDPFAVQLKYEEAYNVYRSSFQCLSSFRVVDRTC